MIHLREVRLATTRDRRGFPFDLPAVRSLRRLRFEAPVTLFVGENGSGKSTILEAFPGAAIWSFDAEPIAQVAYEDLEHVRLTRDPEAFLRRL